MAAKYKNVAAEVNDALDLYSTLREMFSEEDRDINGGDLVDFLGTVFGDEPGYWCINQLARGYRGLPFPGDDEE